MKFADESDYQNAATEKGLGHTRLRFIDGTSIVVRKNLWDARIVRETFIQQPYLRYLRLGPRPVILDVGGYIGDFVLFSAVHLNASRVVVYEPISENMDMLRENISLCPGSTDIVAVNAAVSATCSPVTINVLVRAHSEIHASCEWYNDAEQRIVPGVSLSEALRRNALSRVDLLKLDVEGAEYDILCSASAGDLRNVENVALEWHRIDGFESRMSETKKVLRRAGFELIMDRQYLTARRE